MDEDDDALRGHSEQHGALQTNAAVRDVIWEWLTAEQRPPHRGPVAADQVGVVHPDLLLPGEPFEVEVTAESDTLLVRTTVSALNSGRQVTRPLRNLGAGRYRVRLDRLDPGVYRVRTQAATGALPVTSSLLVWEEAP
jgi:hypothetical protein